VQIQLSKEEIPAHVLVN